ncbi:MAG: glycine--tRNA ligase subunit beta [Desulfobulbaceae bacterium]|nr:glycine--tRNA ligase subunit beta [Desulfobulbaceae bacterium]HIJ77742.1 glycine--tRNA ligase subunit beta [Deltaproteobacteria bacterium]
MQHELLFEIGTEEIPAGYITPALQQMQSIIAARLTELALSYREIRGAATPRRLTITVADLVDQQPDRKEDVLGPPKKAAFDSDGNPTKAAIGFAKSRGASVDDIKIIETAKGEYLMLKVEEKGRPTAELLNELLPEVVSGISFPKSMRWGSGRFQFARPIQWLLAVYNEQTIPFTIDAITSGNTTRGHRFMDQGQYPVNNFSQYVETLRKAEVLVVEEERRRAVLAEITAAADEVGGLILHDDELLATVSNLVESPFAICGTFEERFLALPQEVLITSMREHQKYFAVVDNRGKLMPHFIAVNNTRVKDKKLAAEGHQRVIRARLEDAFFFFKEDQHSSLNDRVAKLNGVIFQNKLGTMLEKTERVTELAGLLAQELAPALLATTRRSAHLAKADLLTDMVGEFPSLQGSIGKDYALLNGEPAEVALAIHEHYLPVRAGGALPTSTPGALVGMADRLDSIIGCFGIGQTPTGTTDPFGLRRLSLGLLHIITAQGFHVFLTDWIEKGLTLYGDKLTVAHDEAKENILNFIKGRFVNDLTNQGIPIEAVEAVTSVSFDDPIDCRQRIEALMAISNKEAFTLLAGAFKRVINIIKDNSATEIKPELFSDPAEQKLYQVYQATYQEALPLIEKKAYQEALTVIIKMKEAVDNFFDEVMVMAEDEAVRTNRLNLLTAIARLFLKVGDFSKMYALNL